MNIAGDVKEMRVFGDERGFVHSLEEVAHAFIAAVEVHGIGGGELAHELLHSVSGFLFEKQMKMVRHEAVGEEVDFVT